MKRTRRKFGVEFKAKVAIEALTEHSTLSAEKYKLRPNQISLWKQEFVEKSSMIFETKKKSKDLSEALDPEKLYSKIGQLEMGNDFLKKLEEAGIMIGIKLIDKRPIQIKFA